MALVICYCCGSVWDWLLPKKTFHVKEWVWYCQHCAHNDCGNMYSLGHTLECTCDVPTKVKDGL